MCLSTVYMNLGDRQEMLMKDVARIDAEGHGFWLINLFGEKRYIEGEIQTIDLIDDHSVIFRDSTPG